MLLFEGNFRICILDGFVDVRKFRQVPDNQEVLVEADGDASIIIEVFETESCYTIKDYLNVTLQDNHDEIINIFEETSKENLQIPSIDNQERNNVEITSLYVEVSGHIHLRVGLCRFIEKNIDILFTLARSKSQTSEDFMTMIKSLAISKSFPK